MNRRGVILLASMLVTFVLGSVHAFSVFILPLESALRLPRSDISLIYSLALVAITLAVLFGYRIYASMPAWWLVLLTCLIAAAGLCLASFASGWWLLFVGYSLLFGLANGLGYGYSLQLVGREMPEIRGFAMGAVTAAYALGSIVFAKIFSIAIASASIGAAFLSLALSLLVCGALAALLVRLARASYKRLKVRAVDVTGKIDAARVMQFWFAYMTSVFAGLMAIGHAAGISSWKGASTELATTSVIMVGVGSALGGFVSGWFVDRWPAKPMLTGLPLLSAAALLGVNAFGDAMAVIGMLFIVGFCYGSVIAIYPVVIASHFGELGAKAYGRVFTAWGFAGLAGPWTAGLIYDWQDGYQLALVSAGAGALLSALIVGFSGIESRPAVKPFH